MKTPYQRIPDEIAAEVLKEASRLHAESSKGYLPSEVKEACTEVGIPAHIVELAIKNVENKIALKKANKVRAQERVKKFKQFSQKAFFAGTKLSVLGAVLYGLFYFKPQWQPLASGAVSSVNEFISKRMSEKPSEKENNEVANPGKTKIDSNDFRRIARGKTKEELIKVFGRPDSTIEKNNSASWFYDNKVLDPFSGKTGNAHVFFYQRNNALGVPNMIVDSISISSN
jgi:hypothetical protein